MPRPPTAAAIAAAAATTARLAVRSTWPSPSTTAPATSPPSRPRLQAEHHVIFVDAAESFRPAREKGRRDAADKGYLRRRRRRGGRRYQGIGAILQVEP